MTDQTSSVEAHIDTHGAKPMLKVSGEVNVYASDFTITVAEAYPQGFVPQELILDVTVEERPSPMKGVMRPFSYSKVMGEIEYQTVRARFSNGAPDAVARIARS